jgi:hypothetical protein
MNQKVCVGDAIVVHTCTRTPFHFFGTALRRNISGCIILEFHLAGVYKKAQRHFDLRHGNDKKHGFSDTGDIRGILSFVFYFLFHDVFAFFLLFSFDSWAFKLPI